MNRRMNGKRYYIHMITQNHLVDRLQFAYMLMPSDR